MKKLAMITTVLGALAISPALAQDTAKERAGKGGAVGGAAAGAVGGALVGGPVGAAVGAIIGGAAGATAASITAPDRQYVVQYVEKHPNKNFRVTGDIVVGGRLPPAVTLYEIEGRPSLAKYRYTVINGRTVLVDPGNRQIVYILK